MERLTNKDTNRVAFDTWELCGLDRECKRDCWQPSPCKIPGIVRRLAAYEDTGATPDEVKLWLKWHGEQTSKKELALEVENARLRAEMADLKDEVERLREVQR